jgi:phage tail tube protein FII
MDKSGAIEAVNVYVDNKLAAEDCTVSLPGIEFLTTEVKAMGNLTLPMLAALDDIETKVTKIGVDRNVGVLTSPGNKKLEYRWVHDKVKADGSVAPEGCKAFFTAVPTTLAPSIDIEIGSAEEAEITYKVTRYKLVVDGKEIILVDRLAHKLKVNGKDYTEKFNQML